MSGARPPGASSHRPTQAPSPGTYRQDRHPFQDSPRRDHRHLPHHRPAPRPRRQLREAAPGWRHLEACEPHAKAPPPGNLRGLGFQRSPLISAPPPQGPAHPAPAPEGHAPPAGRMRTPRPRAQNRGQKSQKRVSVFLGLDCEGAGRPQVYSLRSTCFVKS